MPDELGPLARAARAIARARGLNWDSLSLDVREQYVREAKAVLTELAPEMRYRSSGGDVVDPNGTYAPTPIWMQLGVPPFAAPNAAPWM
jgi:hypothetical protein